MLYTQNHRDNFTRYIREYVSQFQDVPLEELPYIKTYSGRKWRHLKPQAGDVAIVDIAHALSSLCRYTGHLRNFYSVAEHSVRVSYACDPKDAFYGLMHDSAEAYCQDLSRPFKRSPGMEVYKFYEGLTYGAICSAFNMSEIEPESVKRADMVLLATEKRDLFSENEEAEWAVWSAEKGGSESEVLSEKIVPWSQDKAEYVFLARFDELYRRNA
jgi:uncharacterized protein